MSEYMGDIIVAAIAAISTIIGVILGARMSKRTDLSIKKREEKIDACANFMSVVLQEMKGPQTDKKESAREIGIAISRINLLCSDETFAAASKIADQIIKNKITADDTSKAIEQFIALARKDFEKN